MFINKIILFIALSVYLNATGFPKSYYKIKDTKQKTNTFFEYLYPMVEEANNNILKQREFVKQFFKTHTKPFDTTSKQHQKLLELANTYKIKDIYNINKYLKKINIVPPSMTLAQAAVESNWGKSRFTKEANNIFGQWTYKGKGLVPKRRRSGHNHKIKLYSSLEKSIEGYMELLNKGTAYKRFRNLRQRYIDKNVAPNGYALSQTMINYSGIGKKYLKILRSVIRKYDLQKYDKKYYKKYFKSKKQ
jgi:Bax protein